MMSRSLGLWVSAFLWALYISAIMIEYLGTKSAGV